MILIGTLRQTIGHFGRFLRWASALLALMAFTAGLSFAEPVEPPSQPLNYADKSDVELTRLGARWEELSRSERDALLREVKLRMAQRKNPDGVLMIRTQRRYGRIYRSDGRYLKIETKVVRVRPADPNAAPGTAGTQGFGVGFEQRTATVGGDGVTEPEQGKLDPDADVETTPLVRVNEPSQ